MRIPGILAMGLFLGGVQGADISHLKVPAGMEVALVAREPQVVDPVGMAFDAGGRLFVVEMRDYPLGVDGKAGGTVRLLEDLDGDGVFEKGTVFAEGLSFPTSIAVWRDGVMVMEPPRVTFFRDADGDGKAEVRRVLLEGFALGVTDSNANVLRWGLDNRLHGVNGGNGGRIRVAGKTNEVELGRADFSFDPATGDLARTFQTSGGFGLVFDDWGRSFSTYNIDHIQHRVMPLRYLERNPLLPPREVTVSVSDHGEMARIFPISAAETRVNHPEQAGYFSSAGGMGHLAGNVFVCDVVGNLIHRDVLEEKGPTFVARRAEEEKTSEFLASRENAFRPTAVELGPDGALYVADMQRDVIEHPDYIPEKVKAKMDLRAGADRGRIYRIAPKGLERRAKENLRRTSTFQLARMLGETNQWRRMMAQRILVERGDGFAVGLMEGLLRTGNDLARLHALWTLRGIDALSNDVLEAALNDRHAAVRESAIQIVEATGAGSKFWADVLKGANDRSARVRFQAALSIGELNNTNTHQWLTGIFLRDYEHPFSRLAVMSSLKTGVLAVLDDVLLSSEFALQTNAEKFAAVRELADVAAAESLDGVGPFLRRHGESVYLDAVLEGFAARPRTGKAPEELASIERLSAWNFARALGAPPSDSLRRALEKTEDPELLALAEPDFAIPRLLGKLSGPALDALRKFDDERIGKGILERWRELPPNLRMSALNLVLSKRSYHDALLTAIEKGSVTLGELNLDLEQRRALLRRGTAENKARAAKLFGDEEYGNRKATVEEWLGKLPKEGDAAAGKMIFEKLCAQCHQVAGVGFAVGPDLTSVSHRSVEDLLSNILDPNMAINPAYASYVATFENDDAETGILAAESGASIELLQAGGRKVTIDRARIRKLQATGTSLMPEGLEAGLSATDLRNLIAYLQEGR